MDYGVLSSYFDGAVAKRLVAVDIDGKVSNQHEFNGTAELRSLFGDNDIKGIPTTFAYLCDDASPLFDHGFTTWYDARRKHPTRTEYRLYYNDNDAIKAAHIDDLMIMAISDEHGLLVVFAGRGSNAESQLRWLFGLEDVSSGRFSRSTTDDIRIGSIAASILEAIGIEVAVPASAESYLDDMIEKFGDSFPKGIDFTRYSASTLGDLDWKGSPDQCLLDCYEREEILFKVFERYLLENDLTPYMRGVLDVDAVLRITMSTFQRRKSRAGAAFEHQLEFLFKGRGIRYTAQPYTEGKSKPDFIMPSIEAYRDVCFPVERLTMLGAKTTIKERWRQVLEEANRIDHKHLITLDAAVSTEYTDSMREHNLQLVVPRPVFVSYTAEQQKWLMSVGEFCEMLEEKQTGE
jgi:hypothetical protein